MALYSQVYAHVIADVPEPDLLIYLQAPVETLLDRIAIRGIRFEETITADYLHELNNLYARFLRDYQGGSLLIVDAGSNDLVNDDDDYNRLLEEIVKVPSDQRLFGMTSLGS